MRPRGNIEERLPGRTYRLRYDLGRDGFGKRRIARTTFHGTRKDAERELTRLLRSLDTNEHVDPTRMTVGQWLETWIETVRFEISPKTHERYVELVKNFLTPALGDLRITKLTPTHIQNACNVWATRGRRDGKSGGLSPQTRLHIHRVFKSALARAVELKVLVRNPADALRAPKVERPEIVTLTVEQSVELLEAVRHARIYWPVLLALSTGMRRGEILALRWKNVDLDSGTIRVVESLEQTKTGIRFKPPKSGRTRAVALPGLAIEELRRLRLQQAQELLVLGVRQNGDTLVCCREDGEPKQPRSLTHDFAYFADRLGLQISFHDLRHSHATALLASGVHPKVASERLGHSKVAITLDLYSHVLPGMQADAAARIDAAFQLAITRTRK
jgi:integrase